MWWAYSLWKYWRFWYAPCYFLVMLVSPVWIQLANRGLSDCNSALVIGDSFLLIHFSTILLILMYSVKYQWYFIFNYKYNSVLFDKKYYLHTFSHVHMRYNIVGMFQACRFLVSSHGNAFSEERELEENVFSNGDYIETPFLFEQVPCNISYYFWSFSAIKTVNSVTSFLFFFNFIL